MAVREVPKGVLKMASGLISLSGLAGHRRPLCIGQQNTVHLPAESGAPLLSELFPPAAQFSIFIYIHINKVTSSLHLFYQLDLTYLLDWWMRYCSVQLILSIIISLSILPCTINHSAIYPSPYHSILFCIMSSLSGL